MRNASASVFWLHCCKNNTVFILLQCINKTKQLLLLICIMCTYTVCHMQTIRSVEHETLKVISACVIPACDVNNSRLNHVSVDQTKIVLQDRLNYPSASSLCFDIIACCPTHPFFNHRWSSFSGRRFPTVEHSAAELHVGGVSHWLFLGSAWRLISSVVPFPKSLVVSAHDFVL